MLRIAAAAKNWMAFFMVICFWLVIEELVRKWNSMEFD
jgi:hypothetical protein